MDPAPAYNEQSFETQVAEVNRLVLKIEDMFALVKIHFRKLDEAINDPQFKTEPKFAEIDAAFTELAMNSRLSANSVIGNIDIFITMASQLLDNATITTDERVASLEFLTSTLRTDSETSLQECTENAEMLREQVSNLEDLLVRIDALVKERQEKIQTFEAKAKALPRRLSIIDILNRIGKDLLPMVEDLISQLARPIPEEPKLDVASNRPRPQRSNLTHYTSIFTSPFPELDEEQANEVETRFDKALATLEALKASYSSSSINESTGKLISDLKDLAGSLGDFSTVWMLLISHAEELEEYVHKGDSVSDELLTRIYSEIEIYQAIKDSLVAYSLSV